MIKLKKKRVVASLVVFLMAVGLIVPNECVYAELEDNCYYMGTTQKKADAGYGKDAKLKSSDVHYGWELGQFSISGYTRQTTDDNGNIVFLKNVGDTVSLSFLLEQDIEMLNGNDQYHISEDKNGYDDYFGISKDQRTNFGIGTLLVKKSDYQNKVSYLQPYTNYLDGVEKGANTEIQFFEEGDYEVALDYEIQKNNLHIGGWRPFDGYTHYQILIKFSVRNGNCMVYPFDVETKAELTNASFTENGFYIDLANSRYLTVDVKKQNYVEEDDCLVEDTRFNKPAKDGEKFTDEGFYIITVSNKYTEAETVKKIYVGEDPILKAYVTTGQDIRYIKELLGGGAIIEEDGTIVLNNKTIITSQNTETSENIVQEATGTTSDVIKKTEEKSIDARGMISKYKKYIMGCGAVLLFVLLLIIIWTLIGQRKKD